MAKNYLGTKGTKKLMSIILGAFPSREINEDETKQLWDSLSDSSNDTPAVEIEIGPFEELSNWDYTLDDINNTVTLNQYANTDNGYAIVYGAYQSEDNSKVYRTKIKSNDTDTTPYMFSRLNNVTEIKFKEGIDTSETLSMSYMFYGCQNLTIIWGLENLDTSNVTRMRAMFYWCTSLTLSNGPVVPFNTSNVTTMLDMFGNCSSLPVLDLRSFDTSNVTDMCNMFMSCTELRNILVTEGKWITSQADTASMFSNCGVSEVTYE